MRDIGYGVARARVATRAARRWYGSEAASAEDELKLRDDAAPARLLTTPVTLSLTRTCVVTSVI